MNNVALTRTRPSGNPHRTAQRVAVVVALALLVAVALTPASYHILYGLGAFALIRGVAPDVLPALTRPWRWLLLLVILTLLGALFGNFGATSAHVAGIPISTKGALSGVTMVVRAFALVALTSLATSALPLRRWIKSLRHPVAARLVDVMAVASNLVPVQLRALAVASANLEERKPGLKQLPQRLWLLAVHSSLRAAILAETVAFDMAVAAYNSESSNTPDTSFRPSAAKLSNIPQDAPKEPQEA